MAGGGIRRRRPQKRKRQKRGKKSFAIFAISFCSRGHNFTPTFPPATRVFTGWWVMRCKRLLNHHRNHIFGMLVRREKEEENCRALGSELPREHSRDCWEKHSMGLIEPRWGLSGSFVPDFESRRHLDFETSWRNLEWGGKGAVKWAINFLPPHNRKLVTKPPNPPRLTLHTI